MKTAPKTIREAYDEMDGSIAEHFYRGCMAIAREYEIDDFELVKDCEIDIDHRVLYPFEIEERLRYYLEEHTDNTTYRGQCSICGLVGDWKYNQTVCPYCNRETSYTAIR